MLICWIQSQGLCSLWGFWKDSSYCPPRKIFIGNKQSECFGFKQLKETQMILGQYPPSQSGWISLSWASQQPLMNLLRTFLRGKSAFSLILKMSRGQWRTENQTLKTSLFGNLSASEISMDWNSSGSKPHPRGQWGSLRQNEKLKEALSTSWQVDWSPQHPSVDILSWAKQVWGAVSHISEHISQHLST